LKDRDSQKARYKAGLCPAGQLLKNGGGYAPVREGQSPNQGRSPRNLAIKTTAGRSPALYLTSGGEAELEVKSLLQNHQSISSRSDVSSLGRCSCGGLWRRASGPV